MKAPHRRSKFLSLAAISCAAIFAAHGAAQKRVVQEENIPEATTGEMPEDAVCAEMERAVDAAVWADWRRTHPAPFWLFGEERRLAVRNNIIPAHWFADGSEAAKIFHGRAQPGEWYAFQICVASDKARELAWEAKTPLAVTRITPRECRVAAAAMLGEKPDPMWLDVEKRLPLASIDDAKGGILLFENRPLSDSHRHHSHMAGLFPFDVFDLSDAATAATVEKIYAHWRMKGTSQWTGWCVPWAAVLETHLGNAPASVELLHAWDEYFTNPGHASIINPWKPGFGRYGKPRRIGKDGRAEGREIMQTDGQCAFAAAVLEMMAHEVNGKTEFFRGCPPEWKDVSFENIALSDGRRACGRRLDGRATVEVAE